MKLLSFFAIGAYAGVIDNPNGNGSGCTRAGLDDAVRAGMPDGARFEDYVVRHRKSATNKRVDFGTAHCKAAPWQGSNNPYNHVHDAALEPNFVDSLADNEARDAFILANGGTETFPAKSGGFFFCSENDGQWVQSKDMTSCPDTSVQGSWEDHGKAPEPVECLSEDNQATSTCGCLTFNNRVNFTPRIVPLEERTLIWVDRSYTIWDVPNYLSNKELIMQPHKTINSDIELMYHSSSDNVSGYIYTFSEIGHANRNGGWPQQLGESDGWVLMEERMAWQDSQLLIWRKEVTNFSEILIPVGQQLVGGIVFDFNC